MSLSFESESEGRSQGSGFRETANGPEEWKNGRVEDWKDGVMEHRGDSGKQRLAVLKRHHDALLSILPPSILPFFRFIRVNSRPFAVS
jgi:ferric-dicitrate binding protein FerR (iron transport regulator)